MSQQKIELSGIVRNLPDNTVKDGTMQELINLRPKDGALRPVGIKDTVPLSCRDVRFIHRISDNVQVYIGVYTSQTFLSYWVLTGGVPGTEVVTEIQFTADMSYAALRNVLMVSENQNGVTSLLVFNEISGVYEEYNGFGGLSLLPDMPDVTFSSIAYPQGNDTPDPFSATSDTLAEALLAQYVKMQHESADLGYLNGVVLMRCAWEMIDGTIIKQTLPEKVSTSRIVTTWMLDTVPVITTVFTAYNIQFKLNILPATLLDIQTRYNKIIKGLNIYVTMPRSPESKTSTYDLNGKREYEVANLTEYVPNIENETYFFLKHYTLDQLTANTLVIIQSESVLDLATRDQMPINNLSHHTLSAKRLFTYNERIFLGNVKNYLYRPRSLAGLITPGSNSMSGDNYRVYLEFDIAISVTKYITIVSEYLDCNYYNAAGNIEFFIKYAEPTTGGRRDNVIQNYGYWGYPDARAKIARVIVSINDGITFHLAGTYNLTSLQLQNFSFSNGVKITEGSFTPTTLSPQGNNFYNDSDRIQATELNNPFFYPPINSYRVQGEVLGMSSNAIALSTGQFGQFPIYVFTADGIWTMSIGTGENLINTITPLSREVCNNPASITPIDGGTAFTTIWGLFIISGSQVIEISEQAKGKYKSRITDIADYIGILDDPEYSGTSAVLCSVPFLAYISGASIGYDCTKTNPELIVSNVAYAYSWVYSIKYKIWFKITETFLRFVYDFPKCYAWESNHPSYRHDLNAEDFRSSLGDDYALVHAETRPLKLSAAMFKKLNRLLLDGNLINNATFPFQLAVFGTTDGKTWNLLNNRCVFITDDTMIIGRSQYSCKSFIIIFGGHVKEESYFTNLTIDIEERYANKLR